MKNMVRAFSTQKGQVFIAVLVFMLVSALIISPLLRFMYTGRLNTNQQVSRMDELYAADAGVEDAVQNIKNKSISETGDPLPNSPGQSVVYDLSAVRGQINGKTVRRVAISYVDNTTFKVISTGISEGTGKGTSVRASVTIVDFFSNVLNNAITSSTSVNMSSNEIVNGTIQSPIIDWSSPSANATLTNVPPAWPPFVGLQEFYYSKVAGTPNTYNPPSGKTTLSPATFPTGPILVNGNLEIDGPGTVTLTGTVYVTGGLSFKNSPNLVLGNGATSYTIYSDGQTFGPDAQNAVSSSMAFTGVTLYGPGSLIGREGIYYSPNIPQNNQSFILVLSTNGQVNFQPQNNTQYYGSIGGELMVNFQPNATITWVQPPTYLSVPGGSSETVNVIRQIPYWNSDTRMPIIVTASLPGGDVGVLYSQLVDGAGGVPPYRWELLSGSLPSPFTFDNVTGEIRGNTGTTGLYTFTVQLTDKIGGADSATLSIRINDLPTIATSSLPSGRTFVGYADTQLTASSGTIPYTWSWTGYPPGLTLTPAGLIRGTPTDVGTWNPNITVTDAAGGSANTTALPISIASNLVITTTSLSGWDQNAAGYNQSLAAFGGVTPYIWSISAGSLPQGITLDQLTGLLSGTPTSPPNAYPVTMSVTDGVSSVASKPLSITINALPSIITSALPDGKKNKPYAASVQATDGTSPYVWSLAGAPIWLSIDPSSGQLSGTPPNNGNVTYSFTVKVTDFALKADSKVLSILVTN